MKNNKRKIVKLNEGQLRKMIKESIKKVLRESGNLGDSNWFLNNERTPHTSSYDDYEELYDPEKEAKEVFQKIEEADGIDSNNAEVETDDKRSGYVYVHITEGGWQFWFNAFGERVDKHDLYCTIKQRTPRERVYIDYTSPDGEEGWWRIETNHTVLIKNIF